MRIDTALSLACLGLVSACSDEPLLPSAPSGMARPLASVTLKFPGEDPGPPFYTLVERSFLPHTDEWAPIIFVRDPACVPPGFNLLDQLAVPQSFGCPSKVDGHVTYKNGPPPIDFVPWQVLMHGTGAVPVWFVPWSALNAAVGDDVLTISEVLAMPGLRKGTASLFEMTQQPGPMRPGAGERQDRDRRAWIAGEWDVVLDAGSRDGSGSGERAPAHRDRVPVKRGLGTGDWGLGREPSSAEQASQPIEASRPSPQSPVPSP